MPRSSKASVARLVKIDHTNNICRLGSKPFGAKDLLASKGDKTTWGATPYKDQVFEKYYERLSNTEKYYEIRI